MGEFGWAYIGDGAITETGGSDQSIQFKTGTTTISGSDSFRFLTGSTTVHLTGTLLVSGTISASNYVVDNIHVIDSSGSTTFGETNDDRHERTGSLIIASASAGAGTNGTAILSASISPTPGSSFVYVNKLGVNTITPNYDLDLAGTLMVSGNATFGDVVGDIVDIKCRLTASEGIDLGGDSFIIDDKKLYFGTGKDASIEYDEDGTDQLRFAGATAIFEQDVTVEGSNAYFKSAVSNRPRVYIENSNANANAGQLIFHKTSSSPANDDAIGQVVFQSYDAGGATTIYGTMAGEIKAVAAGGERGRVKISVAEYDGTLTEGLTVQGDGSDGTVSVTIANGGLFVPNGNITLYDDRKLIFGNGGDASFEYDEDGTDTLLYAGAALRISDDVKIEFGSGGDSSIEYDENGNDQLVISGSTAGVTLSGSLYVAQGDILPDSDNLKDLGSAAKRWANVYTGDLHLRNDRGNWTIYEEPDMLVVVNNLTGKKYKMGMIPLEEDE
tara:strand:- start:941 stop:2437 length:1497 start_codon:yes stop_codon:yes gene_type:complete